MWIDGGWLDYKMAREDEREAEWRARHPWLWLVRNFFYFIGLLHQ